MESRLYQKLLRLTCSVKLNNAKEVQGNKTEPMLSKYLGKYRIGLHIDDDISVLQNGKTYGFKVYIIGPPDDEWVEKVYLEATDRRLALR